MFKKIKNLIIFLTLAIACFVVAHFALAADLWGGDEALIKSQLAIVDFSDPRLVAINIIRIALGFIGLVAVAIIIYGGYLWTVSGGDAQKIEKAKKILISAIIGLIIIISAFAIVSYIINKMIEAAGGGPGGACDPPCGAGECCVAGACQPCPGGGPAVNSFYITSTSPIDGSASVVRNAKIKFTFNTGVDPLTVDSTNFTVTDGVGTIDGAIAVVGRRIIFTPDEACPANPCGATNCLPENDTITVTAADGAAGILSIGGLDITCGGFGQPCIITFTTGDQIDCENPTVDFNSNQICVDTINLIDLWASDDEISGVDNIEFFVDGASIGQNVNGAGANPFNTVFNWDSTGYIPNASIALKAAAEDRAGNSAEKNKTAVLRPAHCCNSELDGAGDVDLIDPAKPEEGMDCGGECAACAGAACGADLNSDCSILSLDCHSNDNVCASGFCDCGGDAASCALAGYGATINSCCLCENKPVIYWVSPIGGFCVDAGGHSTNDPCENDAACLPGHCNINTPNGAIGNLATIGGKNFGNVPGKVMFKTGGGEIEAELAVSVNSNCSDSWQDDQIIVVVPNGVSPDSPIKVVSANNDEDYTNDSYGPPIADFQLNTIVRPGLCKIDPASGKMNDLINYYGINLTGGTARFGSTAAYVDALNSDFIATLQGAAEVPNIQTGKTATFIFTAGASGNYLNFTKLPEPYSGPKITSFEPYAGNVGQYVTIYGSGFGGIQGTSKVYFGGTEANYDFPEVCADSVWSDNQVIVKAPVGIAAGNYTISMEIGSVTIDSNELPHPQFNVDLAAELKPSLCKISPIMGPNNSQVALWGEYFGAHNPADSKVRFNLNHDQVGALSPLGPIISWGPDGKADKIEVIVHNEAVSGPVRAVKDMPESEGNGLNFKVGNCAADADCGAAVCCPEGSSEAGRCKPEGAEKYDNCYIAIPSSVYEWDFSTAAKLACDANVLTPACEPNDDYCKLNGYDFCDTAGGCVCANNPSAESCSGFGQGECGDHLCPNSPGNCSGYAGGNSQVVGECSNAYCNSANSICAGGCEYDRSANKCKQSGFFCAMPRTFFDSVGKEATVYCADYNGSGKWHLDTQASCNDGWTSIGNGKCVMGSCNYCPSGFECAIGNWDFEDGPVGDGVGDIPGWIVTTTTDPPGGALDHDGDVAFSGNYGFGAPIYNANGVDAQTWSIRKVFDGDFGNKTIHLKIKVRNYDGDPDQGICPAGQEWVGEDDARFWVTALDRKGNTLDTAYSKRAMWWAANGGCLGVCTGATRNWWVEMSYDYIAPANTKAIRVELFADDKNNTCQPLGYKGEANAGIAYDDFSFSVDTAWRENGQEGQCYAGDEVCPAGSDCDLAGQCKTDDQPVCECCCRIGFAAQDCCAPLDCAGECGADRSVDNNQFGYCTGCAAVGATAAEHDAACNCSGNSGKFCDTANPKYPEGICSDCAQLSDGECLSHSASCCIDAMNGNQCGNGDGTAVLGGFCAYYSCNGAAPYDCQGPDLTGDYKGDNTCDSKCGPPEVEAGDTCFDTIAGTCSLACGTGLGCLGETCGGSACNDGTCLCCCDPANDQCGLIKENLTCTPDKGSCTGASRGLCCGCSADSDCGDPNNVGCGLDSCCQARPIVSGNYPADTAAGVCRNSIITAAFDQKMDITSLSGNIIVAGDYGEEQCPKETQFLSYSGAGAKTGLAAVIDKIKRFFRRSIGGLSRLAKFANAYDPVSADHNYCAVKGTVSGYNDAADKGVMVFSPSQALDADRKYYVIIKGDGNISDATSEGVLSANKIGMFVNDSQTFNAKTFANSYIWSFDTGDKVCELSYISIDPASYLFQTPDTEKDFQAYPKSADGQEIAAIPGVYNWKWNWASSNSSVAKVTSTDDPQQKVTSQNVKDGKTAISAVATISEDAVMNPSTVGKSKTGKANVYVLLCENPWPPVPLSGLWEPWIDEDANCTIPEDGCFDTNYELYYCRDAGAAGTADDLPAILSGTGDSVIRGKSDGKNILKEVYYFREGLPAVVSALVVADQATGGAVIAQWPPDAGVIGYKLYYGTASKTYQDFKTLKIAEIPTLCNATACSYEITGLKNNIPYYFVVTSFYKTGGESEYSNEAETTPTDATAPAVPANLSALAGDDQIELSWDANTDDTTGYIVYYGTSPGVYGASEKVDKVTGAAITGLTNGNKYYFAVSAVDAYNNESAKSGEAFSSPVLLYVKDWNFRGSIHPAFNDCGTNAQPSDPEGIRHDILLPADPFLAGDWKAGSDGLPTYGFGADDDVLDGAGGHYDGMLISNPIDIPVSATKLHLWRNVRLRHFDLEPDSYYLDIRDKTDDHIVLSTLESRHNAGGDYTVTDDVEFDISVYAGQTVRLSFEIVGGGGGGTNDCTDGGGDDALAQIDNVYIY